MVISYDVCQEIENCNYIEHASFNTLEDALKLRDRLEKEGMEITIFVTDGEDILDIIVHEPL